MKILTQTNLIVLLLIIFFTKTMIKVCRYGCPLAHKFYLYKVRPIVEQKVGRHFND